MADADWGFSRRRFVSGAVKAGVVAGATAWAAPQLSSVALAQETAGSDPPAPTTEPIQVSGAGAQVIDPATRVGGTPAAGGSGAQASGAGGAQGDPGGVLAFTGVDARRLAAAGGAATLTGAALLAAERHRRPLKPAAVPRQVDPDVEGSR